MKRPVLTVGIIAGIVTAAYAYIAVAIFGDMSTMTPKELQMAEVLGYVRYLLLLAGVVMAMVTYKRNTPGPIPYGRIFVVGLLVSFIIALFVGALEYTYIAYIDPNFTENYTKVMMESMRQKGASATELAETQQQLQSYAWMANPFATGIFYFFETSVIGAIFALIAALFLRRKDESVSATPVINQPA